MPEIVQMPTRPTTADIRARLDHIRQYAEAGWIPSMAAANYAINELHWVLGEELVEAPFNESNWPKSACE